MNQQERQGVQAPARRLPLFYLAVAHLSLALVALELALDPFAFAGFLCAS
ncbi:MAG: hypothetical protein AAF604_18785 [Acidobacteriota bacterium]